MIKKKIRVTPNRNQVCQQESIDMFLLPFGQFRSGQVCLDVRIFNNRAIYSQLNANVTPLKHKYCSLPHMAKGNKGYARNILGLILSHKKVTVQKISI